MKPNQEQQSTATLAHPAPPLIGLGRVLVVRPHNQLGDMLACVPLFRMIKENFPDCHVTLIASPANAPAVVKNKFIDRLVVFDKRKVSNPAGLFAFMKILREGYDAVIVPVSVSNSFTSNLIARLSASARRIGADSLDGTPNPNANFFTDTVTIDWRMQPNRNVYEHSCAILEPFGLPVSGYSSEITFDAADEQIAAEFLKVNGYTQGMPLVCIHAGAGKPPNRWPANRFGAVAAELKQKTNAYICFTGSDSDLPQITEAAATGGFDPVIFINRTIPQVAALAARADLFLTNDTGIMHVAGAVNVPQVSLFGPTDPLNWAPPGKDKTYLRNGTAIETITTEEVVAACLNFFKRRVHCP